MIIGDADLLFGSAALDQNRRVHLRYVDEVDLSLEPVRQSLETDDATIRVVPRRAVAWDYRAIERERQRLWNMPNDDPSHYAHETHAHKSEEGI